MPMPVPILENGIVRSLTVLVLGMCLWIALKDRRNSGTDFSSGIVGDLQSGYSREWDILTQFSSLSEDFGDDDDVEQHEKLTDDGEVSGSSLEYDFYRSSCPQAEKIIHEAVREMYRINVSVAPALVRLVFHDCFIQGCDASILLDPADGIESEKESPPNDGLRGFHIIDELKILIERVCPGVVSCADIIALSAREGILQAGGPFFPILTGRRDSFYGFRDIATNELPSPNADVNQSLAAFASRGFNERETVSLLGAHSIGVVHCKFFLNRLHNFGGTNRPDPSIDSDFLAQLRSICDNNTLETPPSSSFQASPTSSPAVTSKSSKIIGSVASSHQKKEKEQNTALPESLSNTFNLSRSVATPSILNNSLVSTPDDPSVNMASERPGVDFGLVYYRHLLQQQGILFSDQQLMTSNLTRSWVQKYSANVSLFRRDFALAMMKLSELRVLTRPSGQVRHTCSKVL